MAPRTHCWGDTNLHGDNVTAKHLPKETAGGKRQFLGLEEECDKACQAMPPVLHGPIQRDGGTLGQDGFASTRLEAERGQLLLHPGCWGWRAVWETLRDALAPSAGEDEGRTGSQPLPTSRPIAGVPACINSRMLTAAILNSL